MRLDLVYSICAMVAGVLIGGCFYAAGAAPIIVGMCTVQSALLLVMTIGASLPFRSNGTLVMRASAGMLFSLQLIANIIMAWLQISSLSYLLVNGLFALICFLIVAFVVRSGQ